MAQALRIAKTKETLQDALVGNNTSRFWAMTDAAADENYENRIAGASRTKLDSSLKRGNFGSEFREYFSLHDQYSRLDRGFTSKGFEQHLASYNLRYPQKAAEARYEALAQNFSSERISPDRDYELNQLGAFTNSAGPASFALSGGQAALPRTLGTTQVGNVTLPDTRMALRVLTTVTGGDVVGDLEFGAIALGATTKTIQNATITNNATAGTIVRIGESAVDAIVSVGATQISLTTGGDVASFFLGDMWVLIYENEEAGTPHWEFVKLATGTGAGLGADTSAGELNLAAGYSLKHTYTGSAKVYPCFNKLVSATPDGTHAATAGSFEVVPLNDRDPAFNDSELSGI